MLRLPVPILAARFARAPRWARSGVVLAAAAGVTWLDLATPTYVSFHGFYLLTLFAAIWFCPPGVALAVLADALGVSLYMAYLLLPGDPPLWHQAVAYASPVIVFGAFALLIVRLKALVDGLQRDSRTDALTGLRSRRGFLEMAEIEIAKAARGGHDFTVAVVDLDNFKQVNDVLGHAAGDALLVSAGRSMAASLREIDLVGRIGGDEFAILLPAAGPGEAAAVLDRVFADLRRQLRAFGPAVSASIGALAVPRGARLSIGEVLSRADTVMYAIKRGTKDRVVVQALA